MENYFLFRFVVIVVANVVVVVVLYHFGLHRFQLIRIWRRKSELTLYSCLKTGVTNNTEKASVKDRR